jgi:hypothetical protein
MAVGAALFFPSCRGNMSPASPIMMELSSPTPHPGSITPTPTITLTGTFTATSTITSTPPNTQTMTSTRTSTSTVTNTTTSTAPNTSTMTPTVTVTNSSTSTRTATSTTTNTLTVTAPNTRTMTATMTSTNTASQTSTVTNSVTETNTTTAQNTRTSTSTVTNSMTQTSTSTPTNTGTMTPTGTLTPLSTPMYLNQWTIGSGYVAQMYMDRTNNLLYEAYNGSNAGYIFTGSDPGTSGTPVIGIGTFGNGTSGPGEISAPAGIATDGSGNVWIADTTYTDSGNVQAFTYNSGLGTVTYNNTIPIPGSFPEPYYLAYDGNGHLFVIDLGNFHLLKMNVSNGSVVWQTTISGNISGMTYANGYVYYTKIGANPAIFAVQDLGSSAGGTASFGPSGSGAGQLQYAQGVAVAPNGTIYAADDLGKKVNRYNSDGSFVLSWDGSNSGTSFTGPSGVVVDANGNIYIADNNSGAYRIVEFSP